MHLAIIGHKIYYIHVKVAINDIKYIEIAQNVTTHSAQMLHMVNCLEPREKRANFYVWPKIM